MRGDWSYWVSKSAFEGLAFLRRGRMVAEEDELGFFLRESKIPLRKSEETVGANAEETADQRTNE